MCLSLLDQFDFWYHRYNTTADDQWLIITINNNMFLVKTETFRLLFFKWPHFFQSERYSPILFQARTFRLCLMYRTDMIHKLGIETISTIPYDISDDHIHLLNSVRHIWFYSSFTSSCFSVLCPFTVLLCLLALAFQFHSVCHSVAAQLCFNGPSRKSHLISHALTSQSYNKKNHPHRTHDVIDFVVPWFTLQRYQSYTTHEINLWS